MKKKVGDFPQDVHLSNVVFNETRARTDFNFARNHAITLVNIHDQKKGGSKRRPSQELEALKRSALILTVTAWESFVEDTVTEQFTAKLNVATTPAEVKGVFNSVADEWLDPNRSLRRHGPDLVAWTGDGWKELILQAFLATLEAFHTPNTENTNKLFKKYLGIAIKQNWSWRGISSSMAQQQLDNLINLRGRVVHRGRTLHPLSKKLPDIKRAIVVRALNLVYNLVGATERALGIARKLIVLNHKGYRFFFWADEGNSREPLHIHDRKGGFVAKFWILPEVRVAESYDMSPAELRELSQVVKDNKKLIERFWNELFSE
ncbi:DUF4160 domain-containing protein [candidate division KSB1 bacterium]|nr:DUF4160 domain-containing protein [candidate division KSB1 bacterium]